MNAGAVCSICSVQTACLGGQERCSGRMIARRAPTGTAGSVPIITKKVAASNRFTRRRWMQQANRAGGSDGSAVDEGVAGEGMDGWVERRGSLRSGEVSQGSCKAGRGWRRSDGWGLSIRGSSSVAGRGGRACGRERLHRTGCTRSLHGEGVRGTTERARRRRSRQQTEDPAARRL